MKTLLRILLGLVGLFLVVFVILGLTGEKTSEVSRSIQIDAPTEVIYPHVSNLQNHQAWSPWAKRDPEMKNEYEGNMGEVGSINRWNGPESGVGEQEVTAIDPYKRVDTKLRFKEPFEDEADAYIILEPNQRGTEVTWGFTGENSFMQRAMFKMMGMNMDDMIGQDYEEGLAMLKDIAEKSNAEIEAKKAEEAAEAEAMEGEEGMEEESTEG